MTETNTVNAPETATEEKELSPVEKLVATFAKTGRLIVMPEDDASLFSQLITVEDGAPEGTLPLVPHVDWSLKASDLPGFQGAILAREKEGGQVRLVAFANKETALNDAVVQDWCYGKYVQAIAKSAQRSDAYEDQFTVPSGPLKLALDTEGFEERAHIWIAVLQKKYGVKLTERALRYAIESQPWAASKFPDFSGWDKLIGAMATDAEKHGFSTAYYAHCLATRNIVARATRKVDFAKEDIDALLGAIETAGNAENVPATETPPAPAPQA